MADTVLVAHGYYPSSINLPHYVVNEDSVFSLIARFGVFWVAVAGVAALLISRLRPSSSLADRVAFTWMCLSKLIPAFIHKVYCNVPNELQRDGYIYFSKRILLSTM